MSEHDQVNHDSKTPSDVQKPSDIQLAIGQLLYAAYSDLADAAGLVAAFNFRKSTPDLSGDLREMVSRVGEIHEALIGPLDDDGDWALHFPLARTARAFRHKLERDLVAGFHVI